MLLCEEEVKRLVFWILRDSFVNLEFAEIDAITSRLLAFFDTLSPGTREEIRREIPRFAPVNIPDYSFRKGGLFDETVGEHKDHEDHLDMYFNYRDYPQGENG